MKQTKRLKCTNCNMGTYDRKTVPYVFLEDKLGSYAALVCNHCGETLFEASSSDKIEAEVKKRDLWGLRARSKVSEVGNALDVRIPKALADFLSLYKRKEVIVNIPRNRTYNWIFSIYQTHFSNAKLNLRLGDP